MLLLCRFFAASLCEAMKKRRETPIVQDIGDVMLARVRGKRSPPSFYLNFHHFYCDVRGVRADTRAEHLIEILLKPQYGHVCAISNSRELRFYLLIDGREHALCGTDPSRNDIIIFRFYFILFFYLSFSPSAYTCVLAC